MAPTDLSRRETPHPLWWLPNALTVGRILLVPAVIAGILITAQIDRVGWLVPWRATLFLFLLCIATDFLDGKLARSFGVVSSFGRMLDPIADKLLVAGSLIAFMVVTSGDWRIAVPAFAIIFRDITVSGAREHAALSNRVMSPTRLAKWKTSLEFVAIVFLLMWTAAQTWLPVIDGTVAFRDLMWIGGLAALWGAAALSVWTGLGYIRQALRS